MYILAEIMLEDAGHIPICTRIHLARELVSCARMIVASSHLKMAKTINMKLASVSTNIRKIILEFDESNLLADAAQGKASASANVFHHMRGEKKYIGVESINGKQISGIMFDEYRCALCITSKDKQKVASAKAELASGKYSKEQIDEINEMAKSIRTEIENCVLISSEFHNWLTHRVDYNTETLTFRRTYPLKTREDYYKLYHKFITDKTCIKKVTKCRFDESSLIDAISSVCRLKGCVNDHLNIHSKELIQKLSRIFDEINQGIKDDNILNMPSNEGS